MTISVATQTNASLSTGITGQEGEGEASLDLFQLLFSELSALGADDTLLEGLKNGELPNMDSATPSYATLDVRMKAIVDEIQILSSRGVNVSEIQDSEDLEAAYIKIGLNPEEAKLRADQTEEVLKHMDSYLQALKTGKHPQLPMPYLMESATDSEVTEKSAIDIWTEQKIDQAFKGTRRETEIMATLKERIMNKEPLVDAPEFQELTIADLAVKDVAEVQADIPVEAKEESLADSDIMQKLIADLTNNKQPSDLRAEAANVQQFAQANTENQQEQPPEQQQEKPVLDLKENKVVEQKFEANTADVSEQVAVSQTTKTSDKSDLVETNKEFNAETEAMDDIQVVDQDAKPTKRAPVENPIEWKGDKSSLQSAEVRQPTSQPITAMKPTQVEVQVQVQADGSVAYVDADTGDVIAQQDLPRANQQQASFSEQLRNAAQASEVASQTKLHIKPLAEKGGGQIRIDLNPPELGEIEVELKVEDGVASGRISVKNPEVLEQLARDLKVLQQGLAEAGLELKDENMTFAVMEDDKGKGQNGKQDAQGDQQNDEDSAEFAEAQPTATKWVSPDAMVDMDV